MTTRTASPSRRHANHPKGRSHGITEVGKRAIICGVATLLVASTGEAASGTTTALIHGSPGAAS
jgi:hypothetical protein